MHMDLEMYSTEKYEDHQTMAASNDFLTLMHSTFVVGIARRISKTFHMQKKSDPLMTMEARTSTSNLST